MLPPDSDIAGPSAHRGTAATAVVFESPLHLELRRVPLPIPEQEDVVVELEWSGISTGTERLLWTGRMPPFPGLGYPLVPGYESVGRITEAGIHSGRRSGESVFVPGARWFGPVRGLFGGAASHLVVPGARAIAIDERLGDRAVLLALAATAHHALSPQHGRPPELIVGHGVLGRLLARMTSALGHAPPVVWESNRARCDGAEGYEVIDPSTDARRDYGAIYDVSGDAMLLDSLIEHSAPGGEIVLAGFYGAPLSFAFPPAFLRETRIRVAAEWHPTDLVAVKRLVESARLSLDGLITHRRPATQAAEAYGTAFDDPACLKMVLDWRELA